jgi:aspartate racemase
MGPRSTAPFLDMVIGEFQRQCGARQDCDFPPMITLSWPTPFTVDRPLDHDALSQSISCGLRRLEALGVDFIAMPSNAAHIYYKKLAEAVGVPLLNILDETARAVPDDVERIAIVAARPTVCSGLLQEAIHYHSRRPKLHVLDTDPWQAEVDELIRMMKTIRRREICERRWMDLLGCVAMHGADALLVACTDLSGLSNTVPSPLPLIDSAQCLASATVRWWRLAE